MKIMSKHDVHDFILSTQKDLENEYKRIRKRAREDPGTAGDQGEENWATLLKDWLPSYFHIVTKGRILTESGYASPQIDILILHPSYPKTLLSKKLYLAGGVAAAFECKTTLKASHVKDAVRTASEIRKNLPARLGSPYKELNSSIIYGLLAHSHSWKGDNSQPIDNIEKVLWEADSENVMHPIQCLDFISVSDLATWELRKVTLCDPASFTDQEEEVKHDGKNGSGLSSYVCSAIDTNNQEDYFSPIGVLLAGLYLKLSWTFKDMRGLATYFLHPEVNMMGNGQGKTRLWPTNIYSEETKNRVCDYQFPKDSLYDEWGSIF
jgi:hypothetical protein